jgi:hypothetical protein
LVEEAEQEEYEDIGGGGPARYRSVTMNVYFHLLLHVHSFFLLFRISHRSVNSRSPNWRTMQGAPR